MITWGDGVVREMGRGGEGEMGRGGEGREEAQAVLFIFPFPYISFLFLSFIWDRPGGGRRG